MNCKVSLQEARSTLVGPKRLSRRRIQIRSSYSEIEVSYVRQRLMSDDEIWLVKNSECHLVEEGEVRSTVTVMYLTYAYKLKS